MRPALCDRPPFQTKLQTKLRQGSSAIFRGIAAQQSLPQLWQNSWRGIQTVVWSGLMLLLLFVYDPAISWAQGSSSDNSADAPAEQSAPPKRSSFAADDISSEKISQFVEAYLQVLDLVEGREGDLQGAETESESLKVQQEIESEALSIIESAGLTWQEYVQLLGLANIDAEFGERIAAQLQEMTD